MKIIRRVMIILAGVGLLSLPAAQAFADSTWGY